VTFFNPYYVPSSAPFNYSQPIVVKNFVTAGANAEATVTSENQQAMQLFDAGMAAFYDGQYAESLTNFDDALKLMPSDPVLHEMRALALFAVGRFQPAAAVLNSLLASAPGMDWTTLVSLYGNLDDYTTQLRALESHVNANLDDPAATFVLAYHYLVMGHNDEAIELLRRVVRLQPRDSTAQRLLTALEGPPETSAAITAAENAPETDLVGRWRASAGDATIELSIDELSQFTWRATPAGQPPVELSGDLTTTNDLLILDTDEEGTMIGQVKSGGPDRFQFVVAGGPPGDAGLSFERQ
jgi:tetratricopeptide (TPR) repeat protein